MSDTVQAELREFAETPDRFTLLSADVERFDARPVETYEDRVTVMELMWDAFEKPESIRA